MIFSGFSAALSAYLLWGFAHNLWVIFAFVVVFGSLVRPLHSRIGTNTLTLAGCIEWRLLFNLARSQCGYRWYVLCSLVQRELELTTLQVRRALTALSFLVALVFQEGLPQLSVRLSQLPSTILKPLGSTPPISLEEVMGSHKLLYSLAA
jgi:hypothetical protein